MSSDTSASSYSPKGTFLLSQGPSQAFFSASPFHFKGIPLFSSLVIHHVNPVSLPLPAGLHYYLPSPSMNDSSQISVLICIPNDSWLVQALGLPGSAGTGGKWAGCLLTGALTLARTMLDCVAKVQKSLYVSLRETRYKTQLGGVHVELLQELFLMQCGRSSVSKDVYPERGCEVAVRAGTWDSELLSVLCKYIALVKSAGQGSRLSFCCHYEALQFQAPALSSWVHLSGPRLKGCLTELPTSRGLVEFLFSY